MNERNKKVHLNEVHFLLWIVVLRVIIQRDKIIFFYIVVIFTFSISGELVSMLCQLKNNVSTIIISNSNAYCY